MASRAPIVDQDPRVLANTWLTAAVMAIATLIPARALAASTLGDAVASAAASSAQPFLLFIIAAAYLSGFWLLFEGLVKLAQSADQRSQDGSLDALVRIACGSLLCALPDVLGVGLFTLYEQGGFAGGLSGGIGGVSDCLSNSGTSSVVTCVARNVATNLVPVFVRVAFVMFLVVGVAMVFRHLLVLAKSHAQGSRGLPDGWLTGLTLSFMLCNVPYLMELVAATFGYASIEVLGSGGAVGLSGGMAQPPSALAYSGSGGTMGLQKYSELIGWCFVILVMFGVISVFKGMLQLKAHSEGKGKDTVGSGLVHILGGVALANGKMSTCLIVSTFIGNGLGFCS